MNRMIIAASVTVCLMSAPAIAGTVSYDRDYSYDCAGNVIRSTVEVWFARMAASLGSAKANFELGCYNHGSVVARHYWYRVPKGSEYYGRAQYEIGIYNHYHDCHDCGDYLLSVYYENFVEAAGTGNVAAMCMIARNHYAKYKYFSSSIASRTEEGAVEKARQAYSAMIDWYEIALKGHKELNRIGVSRTGFNVCPGVPYIIQDLNRSN